MSRVHFYAQRWIELFSLPGGFVGEEFAAFFVFNENFGMGVLASVACAEAFEKVFWVSDRTNNEIAIGDSAATCCIAFDAAAIACAGVIVTKADISTSEGE